MITVVVVVVSGQCIVGCGVVTVVELFEVEAAVVVVVEVGAGVLVVVVWQWWWCRVVWRWWWLKLEQLCWWGWWLCGCVAVVVVGVVVV